MWITRAVEVVVLIESSKDLENAIQYSSLNGRNGDVIIEEYLKGSEVSVEVMVVNEDVHILQVTDKLTTGSPHFVELWDIASLAIRL